MTTVHPAAIAGATFTAIEPALEFQGVNMPTTPAGSIKTLDVPTVLTRSKSSRTFLKCRKMFAARLLEPFARSLAGNPDDSRLRRWCRILGIQDPMRTETFGVAGQR